MELSDKRLRNLAGVCFFCSGAAALMYEILWLRLLGLVFGNTTYAISTVLAAYMAGLGIGGYVIGRFADRLSKPLAYYGVLECLIGVYAAFTLPIVAAIQFSYVYIARTYDPGDTMFTLVRLLLSLPVLFIPTFMMGATLPVLSKIFVKSSTTIGSGTAVLYGLNTAGALTGTVLTGFWLLPAVGVKATLIVTVILNLSIGIFALIVSRVWPPYAPSRQSDLPASDQPESESQQPEPIENLSDETTPATADRKRIENPLLLAGLFLSGIAAMLFEVAWTRILAAVLGSSTYAFTIMLATFLLGLAIGSAVFRIILSRRPASSVQWAWLQIGIAVAAAIALPIFDRVDLITLRLYAMTIGYPDLYNLARMLLCSALMLIPTFCFGALFPVSVGIYTRRVGAVARGIGNLYLANTGGNLVGSLAAGFLLIPTIGIFRTIQIAILVSAVLGFITLLFSRASVPKRIVRIVCAIVLGVFLFRHAEKGWDPRNLTRGLHITPYNSLSQTDVDLRASSCDRQVLYYREGLNSLVSVTQVGEHRNLKVNGKADASTVIDLHTQVFLGALPHMLHPDPKQSLVIGFGSGTTLAASLAFPVEKVDLVEIEPAVIAAAPYFERINRRSDQNPRANIIIGDGRNHLLVNPGKYDIIISEPSNPWMAGVANLFTVQFYELARDHLNDGGILCQWIHSYSMAPSDFKMIIATLNHIFPNLTLWNCLGGDWIIIASDQKVSFDYDRIQKLYETLPVFREDMKVLNIRGAAGVLSYFELGENDVRKFVEGARLNTDNTMLLEFNAPKNLHVQNTATVIQKLIARHRTETLPSIKKTGPGVTEMPRTLNQLGEGRFGQKRFKADNEVISYFEKAMKLIALDGDHAIAAMGLGRVFVHAGKPQNALPHLTKAVKLDPNLAEAWAYLGVAYQKVQQKENALLALEKAVELDDTNWQYSFWLGQVLDSLKRFDAAVDAFKRTTEANPYKLDAQMSYGRALKSAGRLSDATEFFENLRLEFESYFPISQELKTIYLQNDQLDAAIAVYEDLVRINPYKKQYWLDLILLYDKASGADQERVDNAIRHGRKTSPMFDDELILARDASN